MADTGRRRLRVFHRWFAVVGFVLLLGVVGYFGYQVYDALFAENSAGSDGSLGREVTVEVLPGLTADDVAQLLENEGVIDSTFTFTARVRVSGAAEDLQPGTYQFRVGEDYDSIIAKLREGTAPELARVTIPEGLAIDQTAERLQEEGFIDGASYQQLAGDPGSFDVPAIGGTVPEPSTLEGLLFPETYLLETDATAETLIAEQLATFQAQTEGLDWSRADELGVDPYQVVIIASLIEKEARIPEERPLVAAVIYNRLGEGMALGIDATIRYALEKWTDPLTRSDLQVDSPFNSRERTGLPPTPIASPGIAALTAALEPAEVDYLYYVLEDEEGHHFFTSSYEEFLDAKARQPGQ